MKLLHLADLHIGKSLNDYSLLEDQRYILEQILSLIKERQVDAVLIAGDVYDKSIPSEEAVKLLDYFLCSLAASGVNTYLISGNHDSDERLNFGSALFQKNRLYIAAKYEGKIFQHRCEDEFGSVNFFLLPFIKASQVRHFFPEAEIASYNEAVALALSQAVFDPAERNILLAHQFVAGHAADPELAGSEGVSALTVGNVEKVAVDCFAGFDYVALGHIHAPQPVGRQTVRYAGSPLKYSLSEINNAKSAPLITLGPKGQLDIELLPLRPRREVRQLKGQLQQLLQPENILAPDDYIYAILTDEVPINNAMDIFRQYYPNTLKIAYDNAHTRAAGQVAVGGNVTKDKSFAELLADFYQLMYGCEISAAEIQIMQQAAKEAGVLNETD